MELVFVILASTFLFLKTVSEKIIPGIWGEKKRGDNALMRTRLSQKHDGVISGVDFLMYYVPLGRLVLVAPAAKEARLMRTD